jgi:hypothetical protein
MTIGWGIIGCGDVIMGLLDSKERSDDERAGQVSGRPATSSTYSSPVDKARGRSADG